MLTRKLLRLVACASVLGLVVGGCGKDASPGPTEASIPDDLQLSPAYQTECAGDGCGGGFTGCSDSDGYNPYVYGNVRQFVNG